jgi:hypothetical protein
MISFAASRHTTNDISKEEPKLIDSQNPGLPSFPPRIKDTLDIEPSMPFPTQLTKLCWSGTD